MSSLGDDELYSVLSLLNKIHKLFYSSKEPRKQDVKNLFGKVRKQLFEDCRFVFSSMIPIGVDPATTLIWEICELFGAKCEPEVDETTTHVISARDTTKKIRIARELASSGQPLFIVTPRWIFDCIVKWKKVEETSYLLEDPTGKNDYSLSNGHYIVLKQIFGFYNKFEKEEEEEYDEDDDVSKENERKRKLPIEIDQKEEEEERKSEEQGEEEDDSQDNEELARQLEEDLFDL